MGIFDNVWRSAKRQRKISIGSIALYYRLGRRVPVSFGQHQRAQGFGWGMGAALAPLPPDQPRAASDGTGALQPCADAETALIVGVGPGYGYAVARRLAAAGMHVAMAARNSRRLAPLVAELQVAGGNARAYGCDATDERSVAHLMATVSADLGVPHLVIYSIQEFCPGRTVDVDVPAFELCWRQNCLGGFIVAKEASRRMAGLGRGTIVLTGSTSSLIGRADHLNLAVGKFGLRAIAQVLARELWPAGIHVAHMIIDADIKEDQASAADYPQADPGHIAETVYMLHRQPRTAWTSELEVRPWDERFWEHC